MKAKIYLYIIIGVLLIGFISANDTKDKIYDPISNKIVIIDKATSEPLVIATLIFNTEHCSECQAIVKLEVLKAQDSSLLTGITFRKKILFAWFDYNIPDLTYYIKGSEKDDIYKERTLSQVRGLVTAKGTYYIKITGTKGPKEIIDWVMTLFGDIPLSEWAIWGQTSVYDEIDDSSLNTALWFNDTDDNANITEDASDISMIGSTANETNCTAYLSSKTIPSTLDNLSFSLYMDVYHEYAPCPGSINATASLYVYGSLIKTITHIATDESVWVFKQNTSDRRYYDYYDDGAFLGSILPTSTNITINATATDIDTAHNCNGFTIKLAYVYYTLYGINQTKLLSPGNKTWAKSPVWFNISSDSSSDLVNGSLWTNSTGTWKLNNTNNITGTSNLTNFSLALTEGHYVWGGDFYNENNEHNVSVNNTINIDNTRPNTTIVSPASSTSSKTITINITSVDSLTNVTNCSYNITKGASTEIDITNIVQFGSTNFFNTTATVSSDGTYNLWVNCTDFVGNGNTTNKTFVVNTATGSPGGGGGGGTIIEVLEEGPDVSFCKGTDTKFMDYFNDWRKDLGNWVKFKVMWFALWNHSFCVSTASLVPLES